jgi:CBS domain-containing protein
MVHDVAEFLRAHAPFDALAPDELERLAADVEISYHPAGEVLLDADADSGHVSVVRTGAVELVERGRVLDVLEAGELFGHPAMRSGLPAGTQVRAAEDVLCYRFPSAAVTPALERPAGVRFVASTERERALARGQREGAALAGDPAFRPVGTLVRRPPVRVDPATTIRDAARRMGAASASAVVVDDGHGKLGIVTDRDLRSRVATGDVPVDAPVSAVMTAEAFTVAPEQLGGEVLIELLDRGVRHAPVVDASGSVLGVLDDLDLLASETRTPFRVRRAIGEARSHEELAEVTRALPETVVALSDAGLAPANVGVVTATVIDALSRRLVELAVEQLGPPPVRFSWLALGSLGRREPVPSSDADTGLVWFGGDDDPAVPAAMAALAASVMRGLDACGLSADEHGVRADRPLFARSDAAWRRAVKSWIDDPLQEKALIAVSVLFDGRIVAGAGRGAALAPELEAGPRRAPLLRLLARLALAHRPPTGFLRGVIVEESGEHRGTFDVKRGGVLPIVDLARWAGACAGTAATGTPERLFAGADAEVITLTQARTLAEAWDLLVGLRLEHQVEQLRAGGRPDDHLDPEHLNPLARRYLREAFRAVAAVQRRLAAELAGEQAFGTGAR